MKLNIVEKVIIDIGSGPHPKEDATIFMDVHAWPKVTHVHDLHTFPYPFKDNFADKIYLGDVIEHIIYLAAPLVIQEIYRILKPGGVFEITCPDFLWIMQRVVNDDWKTQANVDWLNKHESTWDNAMDYLWGGWRNPNEYSIPGMGHVNGFSEESLGKLLSEAGFKTFERVPDERNPIPARNAVLKIVATKD